MKKFLALILIGFGLTTNLVFGAIAFDAATNSGFTSGTTHTFAHTNGSGANRILFVCAVQNDQTKQVTGITYAGAAMTFVASTTDSAVGGRLIYLFQKVAPATGANNVVITANGSTAIGGIASSYTGVDQSSPIDVSTTQKVSASPVTTSVTTTVNNDWAILCSAMNATVQFAASTNSTARANNTTFLDNDIFDNNTAISTGAYSMTITNASVNGTSPAITIMAAFKPVQTTNNAKASLGFFRKFNKK